MRLWILVITLIVTTLYAEERYTYLYYNTYELNLCDLDDDNDTDVVDIILVINHILGSEPLETHLIYVADVNDDSMVDVLDIILIVDFILDPPGYEITDTSLASMRFPLSSYYLNDEYMVHYFTVRLNHEQGGGVIRASLREDDDGQPGDIVGEWTITLASISQGEYYIYLTNDCISTEQNYHWVTLQADDEDSYAEWIYSSNVYTTTSVSNDGGATWETSTGYGGMGRVRGEKIYVYEPSDPVELPGFSLADENPNSELYQELIGPEYFSGWISCYYFSSVHCGTCQVRFGDLNEMYEEFLAEGVNDIIFVGNSGINYDTDDYSDMVDGTIIPWTQDTEQYDIWDAWDISLRDLVVLNREGFEITRINLSTYGIDSSGIGECTGNYETIKNLLLEFREQY